MVSTALTGWSADHDDASLDFYREPMPVRKVPAPRFLVCRKAFAGGDCRKSRSGPLGFRAVHEAHGRRQLDEFGVRTGERK